MDNDFKMPEDHSRTIIHIDIDCFYAQVEMIKDPTLYDKPLGIQQKNIIVTSNYVARKFGIEKCMLLSEAVVLCPKLVIVKGEDLHDYRQLSYKVTNYLQTISPMVERLGLDENYIDVTNLVNKRISEQTVTSVGHIFGDNSEDCQCGCYHRIGMGSIIAQELRDDLYTKFKLTCCAGIAHNKLLAKLTGAKHKPNQQTLLYPSNALELVYNLGDVNSLPGVGKTTADILLNIDVRTVSDLQLCDSNRLKTLVGPEKAKFLQNLSNGIDTSVVKSSGKPQSIGIEDSCRTISVETEVRAKLEQLLGRLMILLREDGRIPRTLKLTVRKFNTHSKVSHRETKQCNLSPTLFTSTGAVRLTDTSHPKLLTMVMSLFSKLINIKRAYHITLLGLSFTKFQERVTGRNTMRSFLTQNIEVQTVTSIASGCGGDVVVVSASSSPSPTAALMMDYSSSSCDFNTDGSESELEPSPKKAKFTGVVAKRRCATSSFDDCPSPSKLKVSELRLNSKEYDSEKRPTDELEDDNQNVTCPPNVDMDVFKQLPLEMQQELWQEYQRDRDREQRFHAHPKKQKVNTILNYLVKN